jgi:ketosteroid isomerase-like protein
MIEDTPSSLDDEHALRALDGAWNEAYPRSDAATIDGILADEWVGIVRSGEVITKAQLLAAVGQGNPFTSNVFDELTYRVYGDAAVVTGRLTLEGRNEAGPFRLQQRYMRVYVKKQGRWQAVATQVTPVAENSQDKG